MDDLRKFLFVDDDEDHRFFLAVAMVRTFPTSLICECSDSELAFITSRSHRLSAAVVHRATDMPGVSLVHRLRKENPELPIVFVAGDNAGRDRGLHAGATSVLHYDDWEKIGPLVEGILKCLPRAGPAAAQNGSISLRLSLCSR